jgi:chromosome partitioning protein
VAKANLPVLRTRLHRLVAFQEMSFTGILPTSGQAAVQTANFLYDLEALGGLPKTTELAS